MTLFELSGITEARREVVYVARPGWKFAKMANPGQQKHILESGRVFTENE